MKLFAPITRFPGDGLFDVAVTFFAERILMPIVLLAIVLVIVGGSAALAWWAFSPKVERIELVASEWQCSASQRRWQPPYSCGGKLSRTCPGYFYDACTQWSEK